jgi:hypothetical protein
MSDDPRQDQAKIDRGPGPGVGGASSPQEAIPAPVSGSSDREAQVKAITPTMGSGVPAPRPAPAPVAPVRAPLVATAPLAGPTGTAAAPGARVEAEDDEDDEDESVSIVDRLRRLPPALIVLAIGSLASLVLFAIVMTSHTAPVPLILSSALITGLIFAVDAGVAGYMSWQAAQNEEAGRAVLLAIAFGMAAVTAASAFGGTVILVLLLRG